MINLSVPDTIDERTINKKKLTPFTIQVCLPSVTFKEDCAWSECSPEVLSHTCSGLRHYSQTPGFGLVIVMTSADRGTHLCLFFYENNRGGGWGIGSGGRLAWCE